MSASELLPFQCTVYVDHHLAWLCIMEHGDLFAATGDNALWPHVVQHIEFRVTLEECVSKDPSSEPDQSTRAIEVHLRQFVSLTFIEFAVLENNIPTPGYCSNSSQTVVILLSSATVAGIVSGFQQDEIPINN